MNPKSVAPNQNFSVGVIFFKTGIVILTQGKLSLSYKRLLSVIALFIMLVTTGKPILSKFMPFYPHPSQEINQKKNLP